MHFQLMPLHWGLVDRTLTVSNVEPESRVIPPVRGSDLTQTIKTSSQVERVSGAGSVKRVSGSGTAKIVGGGGKTCL